MVRNAKSRRAGPRKRSGNLSIREVIEGLDKELKKLKDRRDARLASLQSKCKHKSIYEGEYKEQVYFDSLPTFRVCSDCGYAEEGWGCGYYLLNGEAIQVKRDFAQKHVLKWNSQTEMNNKRFGRCESSEE